MTSASTLAPTARLSHATGFWVIAAAFLAVMAFSTIPTPLYALYQARDGFGTVLVTVIFAAYALGVMASLYLAGHVSDWLGRRRVILAAILVELIAAVLFLAWPAVPGLLVARFVTGVGVGMLTATATAHLGELRSIARPREGSGTSSAVSSFVNVGGLALGPLVAGVLAQWVSTPLVVPYVVFIVLLALSAVGVALVPETVERPREHHAYRPQRVALPAGARSVFLTAGAAAFSAFAVFGIFTSLAPGFIAGTLHETSRFIAGSVTFAVFGAAAVAQVLSTRLRNSLQLRLAALLMAVGLTGLAVAVVAISLPLFVAGGVVAGAGVGIQFRSAVAAAASLAQPAARGEVLAALFLIAYAGLAVPVLLVGVALAFFPAPVVLIGFAVVVLVLAVSSSAALIRTRRFRA